MPGSAVAGAGNSGAVSLVGLSFGFLREVTANPTHCSHRDEQITENRKPWGEDREQNHYGVEGDVRSDLLTDRCRLFFRLAGFKEVAVSRDVAPQRGQQ